MLTIRAEIKSRELKSDGTYNVKVRFTLNRAVKRLSTSIFVTPQDMTKSFKLKNPKFIKQAEDLVRSYQDKCAKLQLELNHYTLDDIMDFLNDEQERTKKIDFIKFSREWIATTDIKGKRNYNSALNALVSCIGKEELDINKITGQFLHDFTAYLNKRRDERLNELAKQGKRLPSNRALSLYLGSIRHLHSEAKKKYNDYDRNIIMIPNSPFESFKVPKPEATRKRALSADLLKQIWQLPYRYNAKGKEMDCLSLQFSKRLLHPIFLFNRDELRRPA